ncbi:MAG: hypothetical protein AAGA91_18260 [Pseudomonadota bacterium]
MPPKSDKRFFFVHVMKTGGTSFADIAKLNFADDQCYPDTLLGKDADRFQRVEAYCYVPKLLEHVNGAAGSIRMVRGHVPFGTLALLEQDYEAITLLRNPVERTISYLRHCQRYHKEHHNCTLNEIYDDPWFYESFIHNYQTKIFSMSAEETVAEIRMDDVTPCTPFRRELKAGDILPPDVDQFRTDNPVRFLMELLSSSTGVIHADESRLEIAKDNLQSMSLVGITEGYSRFLMALQDIFGWRIEVFPHKNTSSKEPVSDDLNRRIASDNALDMELYELARTMAP